LTLLSRFFAGFFGGVGAIAATFICILIFEKINETEPNQGIPTTEIKSPDFIELSIIERVQQKNGLRYSVQIKNNGTQTVSHVRYGISFYLDGLLVNSCREGRYDELVAGASHIDETHCIDKAANCTKRANAGVMFFNRLTNR